MKRHVGRKPLGVTALKSDGLYQCPLCECCLPREGMRAHHMILWSGGGHGGSANVVLVCADCHALIHGGTQATSRDKYLRLAAFMLERHGLLFYVQYPKVRGAMGKALAEGMTLADARRFHQECKRMGTLARQGLVPLELL